MKLRQLITLREREIFGQYLTKARATHGLGFGETRTSRLGHAHLAVADLYALYEDDDDPPEKMVAGFRYNDLATLPQSYPRPDMSYLDPRFVLEGGELWSLSRGAGRVATRAAAGIAGLRRAKAILIQAIARPIDLTSYWHAQHFVDAGEAVLWPFARASDGSEVWAQPMTLEGERLELWIREGFELFFNSEEARCVVKFNSSSTRSVSPIKPNNREPNSPILRITDLSERAETANGSPRF